MKTNKINPGHRPNADEVLPYKALQSERYYKLKLAMYLWNGLYEKCRIVLKTDGEIKTIETPVWFVSEKYVRINAGVTILVSCILDVVL